MKYIFFLILIISFSITKLSAQQSHFLYFQTEAKQPFYIKVDNKTFNSSSSGYLIVPKLKDDKYKIAFGFPKSETPEQTVNFALEKDAGFLIRNFPNKGWALFDLQSLNILTPGEQLATESNNKDAFNNQETKKDNFSEMLATVVNDSTIKQKDLVKKKDAVKEVSETVEEKTSDENKAAENLNVSISQTDTAQQVLYTVITKSLQTKNINGMEMIYTDESNNNKDTIRIFIPAIKDLEKQVEASQMTKETDTIKTAQQQPESDQSVEKIVKDSTVSADNKLTNQDTEVVNIKVEESNNGVKENNSVKEEGIVFLPAKSGMPNSNCKQYATEEDFLKLRKKMAAENNNDDMIKTAKKMFKLKCFTTKDIKNLSTLFLNDEGRYNFFDAAYAHVSDSNVFNTLQDQLTDTYYLNRFNAMIHQ